MDILAESSVALEPQRSLEVPIVSHTRCTKAQTAHSALRGFFAWKADVYAFILNLICKTAYIAFAYSARGCD